MKLKSHVHNIVKCKDLFANHTEYDIFSKALAHLIDELEFFEKYIHHENPFKQHFHARFQEPVDQAEDCYALHEDIVMFFREKSLRLGEENLEEIERAVLKDTLIKSPKNFLHTLLLSVI